jgi:type II secretory pathway component GspD/PulD (secretin)
MRVQALSRCLLIAGVLGIIWSAGVAYGTGDLEASGVSSRRGNASPSAAASDIDTYTFQDEQINIDGSQDSVVKVLRANQKNLVNDYVVRTFPIKHAPPIEVRAVFRNIASLEGGRAEVIRDKIQKMYWLWVVAPKFQMPYIEAALKELDVPWLKDDVDGSYEAYYKAKFREASAINALAAVAAAGGDHTSVVDEVNNALLRIGEPYRTQSYVKYANVVDKPIPQVLLEAAVYEVEVSKELRLGLDYIAWKNGPGRNLFEFISWASGFDQSARSVTSKFDPFVSERASVVGSETIDGHGSGTYAAFNYLLHSAFIDFLEARTLSAVVQVLHFQVSPDEDTTLVSGIDPVLPFNDADNFPDLEEEEPADIPVWNRTLNKDEVAEIGFVMDVRPIVAEETTELQIELGINKFIGQDVTLESIVGQTSSGAPQVRRYELSTTVLARDGQPICIGGLRRTEDVKNTAKVPILGSIPVLGYLFGHEANVQRETETVVVLTPKIRLGSEADLEMASQQDEIIRKTVLRQMDLSVPQTQFGFDQWLIGTGL